MKNTKKILVFALAAVLLVSATVFTTMAYLTDKTNNVENTFTMGKVSINLDESNYEDGALDPDRRVIENRYERLVPGETYPKDPTVTVNANSEKSWLFVKVNDTTNGAIHYGMAEGWTALDEQAGVYYRIVETSEDAQNFAVLAGNEFTVDAEKTIPEKGALTFTAYAIQYDGFDNATAAWKELNK